jgi:transposase-like protein
MSNAEIAADAKCDESTITRWAKKHGFPKRTNSMPWKDEETLRRLYCEEKMSLQEIADHFDIGSTTVSDNMDQFGIERRSLKESHAVWRPHVQYRTGSGGYVEVAAEVNGETKRALVHQLIAIAEGADPFDLFGGGHAIHHKNGLEWDNRASNLEVMGQSEHGKMHADRRYGNAEAQAE